MRGLLIPRLSHLAGLTYGCHGMVRSWNLYLQTHTRARDSRWVYESLEITLPCFAELLGSPGLIHGSLAKSVDQFGEKGRLVSCLSMRDVS